MGEAEGKGEPKNPRQMMSKEKYEEWKMMRARAGLDKDPERESYGPHTRQYWQDIARNAEGVSNRNKDKEEIPIRGAGLLETTVKVIRGPFAKEGSAVTHGDLRSVRDHALNIDLYKPPQGNLDDVSGVGEGTKKSARSTHGRVDQDKNLIGLVGKKPKK